MAKTEIRVPDLGDFKDVPIVEVLVSPGDIVAAEDALVTVESDKATMDIPSPSAGRVVSISVKPGDLISEGSLLGEMDVTDDVARPSAPSQGASSAPETVSTRQPVTPEGSVDLVVIGAGPGGYSAAFRAADLGLSVMLIDRRETLGGVCLNVGCIPSKALLHVMAVKEEAERLGAHGIHFAAPEINLEKLSAFKNVTVGRLTAGLAHMASKRKVEVVTGEAVFTDSHTLKISGERTVTFRHAIIATGSEPIRLPFLPEEDRIVDSTGALDLSYVPKRMLVVGGGIIGLEMATIYSGLGARVDVVEMADRLLLGVDADLVSIWQKRNKHRFDRILLSTKLENIEPKQDGLVAHFDGDTASGTYDLVLVSAGRVPNSEGLDLEAAGVTTDKGFVRTDLQMKTNIENIFAIGDIAGPPMLAHKAVHEGHVAAEVIAGHRAAMDATLIPSVAYTDPEIAWVGMTETDAKAAGATVKVSRFPWSASGRAIASGADYGVTKLIFDEPSGRIVGGAIVGPHAGDMLGEISLAIEMGADAVDIGRTIHPHPTLGETIGLAAEVAEGVCTDLL